jgi:hypothetical protein
LGDVPHNAKRGRVTTPAILLRVGPRTPTNPKPTKVGKLGVQGGEAPMARGWGVSPHKNKRGNELPTLATLPRVGPKTPANPQPTGVGKRGGRGAKPAWCGGCPSTKPKEGGSSHITNPAMSGTQNAGKPLACESEQGGSRGRSPMAGGMGDVPPQKQKRERVAHISNPATSGTQNAGKPSAYEGGQRGVQGGGAPHGGGRGGVSPTKP